MSGTGRRPHSRADTTAARPDDPIGRRTLTIRPVPAFTPYVVVAAVYLVAVFRVDSVVSSATKGFLMPALLVGLLLALAAVRPFPRRTALLAGLGILFSWFGDVAIAQPGDLGFLLGLAGFFVAHLAYLALFVFALRLRRLSLLAVVYAVWWVAFVALLAPHAGALLVPLALYGAVLGAMAAVALGGNRWIAAGGALFVISDSLLGLHLFLPGFDFGQVDLVIMVAYIAAQGAIAVGAFVHARRAVAVPPLRAPIPSP